MKSLRSQQGIRHISGNTLKILDHARHLSATMFQSGFLRPNFLQKSRFYLRQLILAGSTMLFTSKVFAQSDLDQTAGSKASSAFVAPFEIGALEALQFSMFAGAMAAALLTAGWFIRERNKVAAENDTLKKKFAELNLKTRRNETLLSAKNQCIIAWDGSSSRQINSAAYPETYDATNKIADHVEILGYLPIESGAPQDYSSFLDFSHWLAPESAAEIDELIKQLRHNAQSFATTVKTTNGTLLNVDGHITGGLAIVRFTNLDGIYADYAALQTENKQLIDHTNLLHTLLDRLDQSVWIRNANGALEWVNRAYSKSVEAETSEQAIQEKRELFGQQARERIERERQKNSSFRDRVAAVINGDRHIFDVTDVVTSHGSAGLATNISEIEQVREELQRTIHSHAETLDQLSTAVAMFDPDMKLQFFNQAFAKLWGLDTTYLETLPSNALLFDRLRSEGKLPESPEWRRWKDSMLSAYTSVEPQEHLWHLPDTRILRVVANPHPKGGVTWFFENMTEKYELEGRYNTLIKVQGETLDHLAEGVVVFGSDGRIRLSNPSFANLWSLPLGMVSEGVHISEIARMCALRTGNHIWHDFISTVTGFADGRDGENGQLELSDGMIMSYAIVPLPKGQTMLTFVDVTDTARIERVLKDKNEALELADQIKNDFVQHVSYELRSPLTNIIGFTELLQDPAFGEMNSRQLEYLDHISSSSNVLLAIVNDILDLATVDAGIMQLEIDTVHVADAVAGAAERIGERLREHNIFLQVNVATDADQFLADANRVHQVLFNLLSNAANYAPEDSTILLAAYREEDTMIFSVHDDGPGMPHDVLDAVFKRFQSHNNGGRKRGAGLGLALVKSFVELHGGVVEINTGPGHGTTVTCRFPLEARSFRSAAE